ncbi:MAG TPA: bifunctional diguanylate cyclase/phosphodiesterase [Thermoanaerobaculia bacterium]|nr:bifunctional diguanylate cyclase/phosphodiesterase [Thermoanaerobaculia bacterium]HQR67526.1 bifunctional diguanylate cyclase/phosphodiesterase [Thermoanaerobaculia bacterium]
MRRTPSGIYPATREGRRPASGVMAKRTLSSILATSPDPTALFDDVGRVLSLNDAALAAGAPAPADGELAMERFLPFWSEPEGLARLLEGAARPDGIRNLEVVASGHGLVPDRMFWVSTRPCPDAGNGCFVAVAREVTEKSTEYERLKKLYNELAEHMSRDGLTGFLNRENFRFVLDREIAEADRAGTPLALVYVGLDRFKSLNDTHGLAAGDEYLRVLGESLRGAVLQADLLARVGGDEVAILLPETGPGDAMSRAEALLELIAALAPVWEGNAMSLTASAGVAIYPDHAGGAADLVRAADLAMHQAKRRGGARVLMHDPDDRERHRISGLREQANRIRAALAEQRFVPVFQPVADIATGRIVAVETLARLKEPSGHLTTPASFLDAAERFGFVTQMDRLVIAAAFERLASSKNKTVPNLEMALNLSGLDFEDDSLVADISRIARAKGIRPERVTFEITETAVLRDLARVQHFTRALTAEGFRFALDDFGVGFSSFRYLRELPVSTLKLDMSYIQNLARQPENRVFVRGITEICRGLGVKTVAEGVESREILEIVGSLGVDRAQGHHIGHPVPDLPAPNPDDTLRRTRA